MAGPARQSGLKDGVPSLSCKPGQPLRVPGFFFRTPLVWRKPPMIGIAQAFSPSYAQARTNFWSRRSQLACHRIARPPAQGAAMVKTWPWTWCATARPMPKKLLIVSSACHGVEGYCGSGVQVFALHDQEWRDKAHAMPGLPRSTSTRSTRMAFAHAPFHARERGPEPQLPGLQQAPAGEHGLPRGAALLLPEKWPPGPENQAAVAEVHRHQGRGRVAGRHLAGPARVSAGRVLWWHQSPPGATARCARCCASTVPLLPRSPGSILHTGLGPSGHGERIYAGNDDAVAVARARAWWDGGGATPVTSIYDGSSTSAFLTGLMWTSIYDECPMPNTPALPWSTARCPCST